MFKNIVFIINNDTRDDDDVVRGSHNDDDSNDIKRVSVSAHHFRADEVASHQWQYRVTVTVREYDAEVDMFYPRSYIIAMILKWILHIYDVIHVYIYRIITVNASCHCPRRPAHNKYTYGLRRGGWLPLTGD